MVSIFCSEGSKVVRLNATPDAEQLSRTLWIDLYEPTRDEERHLEELLGINIPTRDEMQEIEPSNRLYELDGNLYMTAAIVSKVKEQQPEIHSVTFVLTRQHLITVRYSDPVPFETYHKKIAKLTPEQQRPELILVGLLEAIIGRLADVLEWIGQSVDTVSKAVFASATDAAKPDYQQVLKQVGRQGDMTFKARESIASLVRLVSYLDQMAKTERRDCLDIEDRLKTIIKDATAISDYAMFINGNISFLLDGTLGIIGMEQNASIKIFTIVGVVLMPPTLVASIYGMNFQHMPPEISWKYGFFVALALMLASAYVPYRYFKNKNWL